MDERFKQLIWLELHHFHGPLDGSLTAAVTPADEGSDPDRTVGSLLQLDIRIPAAHGYKREGRDLIVTIRSIPNYIVMNFSLLGVSTIDIQYTRTMTQIVIKKLKDFPESEFEVTVSGNKVTKHKVTLTEEYYTELISRAASPEELVKKSFEYLLAREPNTSILSEFNLKVISTYFPGYEREIKSRF